MRSCKWLHSRYEEDRKSRGIGIIDHVFGVSLIILCAFRKMIGLSDFVQNLFKVNDLVTDIIFLISVVVLMKIEQVITYYIDKWISK